MSVWVTVGDVISIAGVAVTSAVTTVSFHYFSFVLFVISSLTNVPFEHTVFK